MLCNKIITCCRFFISVFIFQPFNEKLHITWILTLILFWHATLWPYKWPLTFVTSFIILLKALCWPWKAFEWTSHFTFIVTLFTHDQSSQWYIGPHLWILWDTLHDEHWKAVNTSTRMSTFFLKIPQLVYNATWGSFNLNFGHGNVKSLMVPWWPLCQLSSVCTVAPQTL